MLRRQKMLLGLVANSRGKVTHTALMKMAFLARHETPLRTDHTFYHFVPYKYGPFSFALYRELASLKRYGYLAYSGDHITVPDESASMSQKKIHELPTENLLAIEKIADRYSKISKTKLLRHVYTKYPWYSSRSELSDLRPTDTPSLRVAPPAVYTMGYEGLSVDAFFRELLRSGIKSILDVRANPISRKYGFAKSSMREIATKLSIGYRHIPELGIPGSLRKSLGDFASYQRLFADYERTVLRERTIHISDVASFMEGTPCVLVCMEKDARCCHRSRLAKAVSAQNGLLIKNL